jgi:hypothetical protein
VELFRRKQGNKGLIPADTGLDHAPVPDPVRPRSNALSRRDDFKFLASLANDVGRFVIA